MKRRNIILARVLTFVAGAGMLGTGILNSEYKTVLQKAIKVCLECIGIG